MDNTGKIAVILVNYNNIKDTCDCVDSLKRVHEELKIIIVDNASTGKDADLLAEKYKDGVYVIKSEENLGFSGGNNIGIRYALDAGYEFIVILNNDTIVAADMFEKLRKNADKDKVVVPLMYYYTSPKTIWFGGGRISKITGNGKSINKGLEDGKVIYYGNVECTFATGCCMMLHRSIIEKIGLLDESYFMYCEDTEYSIRLNMNKIKIILVPEAKLWHKVSQSIKGDKSFFSLYYINRNRLNYVKKYKDYFYVTAYPFSILSRYIRMLQKMVHGDKSWKAIYKAINDHKKSIDGEIDDFM